MSEELRRGEGLRKYLLLCSIAGFVVAVDQLTKLYVHTHFLHGESVSVLNQFFSLTYVRNYGAAFGVLADSPALFRQIFFLFMPPVAMIIIFTLLRSVNNRDNLQIFALSSIFGGAMGNYIDRLKYGYVVDFVELQAPIGSMSSWFRNGLGWSVPHYAPDAVYSWPTFNLADVAIVLGILTILGLMITDWRRAKSQLEFASKK